MIQGTCRLWNISISALVFLTVYNILLTLKLMYTPECVKHVHQQPIIKHRPTVKPLPLKCHEEMNQRASNTNVPLHLDLKLGRWDNRLKYKLYDNIIVGEKYGLLSDIYQTCLATQSSLEKLASLVEVSSHWAGPISLATFAAGEEELNALLLYILFLRQCNSNIREKVLFHLAMPKERKASQFHIDVAMLYEMDCGDPVGMLHQLVRKVFKANGKWRKKLLYPQNHLRNLARKNCQSGYVFLTDVDIVPSRGMAEELDIFLQKSKCRQCAYVIPTYELDERVHFPFNKTELIRLANKGLAKPFHHKVFIYNQYATNFSRWQSNLNEEREIHVSHPVTNFEFLYEPFYVAPDTVPPHDERFIGYGYTRNTQVYEMFVAGYEFLVLSPIFTCHWGLLSKKPSWREHQNILNRKLFDGFKKEIFAKYNKDPLNMMALRKN